MSPPPSWPTKSRDHVGPLHAEGTQVGVDHEQSIVLAKLGVVVRQPRDRSIAGLAKSRVGMLDPAGKLDVLVAHERIAKELNLRRCGPRDQQDADLLAHDPNGRRGDVVFLRQLGAGVFHACAILVLTDDPGCQPERHSLEHAVLTEHHALAAQAFPRAVVDALFQNDRRLGVAQAAGLDDHAHRHRIAHEDHRAGLDLGKANVARSLVAGRRKRENGDILRAAPSTARSGSSPVFERPSVAMITPATG